MAPIEGTDAWYAEQERKNKVPKSKRHYGDPEPMKVHPSFPKPQHPDGSDASGYINRADPEVTHPNDWQDDAEEFKYPR